MDKEPEQLEPGICPQCKGAVTKMEFRQFGPQGIFALVCHKECMYVLGTIAVPIIPDLGSNGAGPGNTPKHSPIIKP